MDTAIINILFLTKSLSILSVAIYLSIYSAMVLFCLGGMFTIIDKDIGKHIYLLNIIIVLMKISFVILILLVIPFSWMLTTAAFSYLKVMTFADCLPSPPTIVIAHIVVILALLVLSVSSYCLYYLMCRIREAAKK